MTLRPLDYAEALASFMTVKTPEGSGVDFWTPTSTGNYSADCEKGGRLGRRFVEFVGAHPTQGNKHLLTWIVLDMIRRGDADTGLVVGFMRAVGDAMLIGAKLVAWQGDDTHGATGDTLTPVVDEWRRAYGTWKSAYDADGQDHD